MVEPASERETGRWLLNGSCLPELLGCRKSEVTLNRLYRCNDQLLAEQEWLEQELHSAA